MDLKIKAIRKSVDKKLTDLIKLDKPRDKLLKACKKTPKNRKSS